MDPLWNYVLYKYMLYSYNWNDSSSRLVTPGALTVNPLGEPLICPDVDPSVLIRLNRRLHVRIIFFLQKID